MTTPPLPAAPSLEQLRNRARDLQRAHRAGDPEARARVAAQAPDAGRRRATPLKLSAAQLVVAREHGFASWPRLKAYVDRVAAHGPGLQFAYHGDLDYYAGRAEGLRASAIDGTPGAVAAFAPPRRAADRGRARAPSSRGCTASRRWPALRRHVAALRNGGGEPFARAYRALEAHDHAALRPSSTASRGSSPRAARTATTSSAWRPRPATSARSGSCSTAAPTPPTRTRTAGPPLHQTAYSNQTRAGRDPARRRRARDRRRPRRRRDAARRGAVLGPPRAAELLAERGGLHPRNLRVAAGLGRLDVLDELVATTARSPRGRRAPRLLPPARRLPRVAAGGGAQEALDEALCWAARNDRVDALDAARRPRRAPRRRRLPRHRARLGRRAGAHRRRRAAASRSARTRAGAGPSAVPTTATGVTPLHLAAQNGARRGDPLAARGRRRPDARRERLYGGTPADWAGHFGHEAAAGTAAPG